MTSIGKFPKEESEQGQRSDSIRAEGLNAKGLDDALVSIRLCHRKCLACRVSEGS